MKTKLNVSNEHKYNLPNGVQGFVEVHGADNWNYFGCRFFINYKTPEQVEIFNGDYVIECNGLFTAEKDKANELRTLRMEGKNA